MFAKLREKYQAWQRARYARELEQVQDKIKELLRPKHKWPAENEAQIAASNRSIVDFLYRYPRLLDERDRLAYLAGVRLPEPPPNGAW